MASSFRNPDFYVVVMLREPALVDAFASALGGPIECFVRPMVRPGGERTGLAYQLSTPRLSPTLESHHVATLEVPSSTEMLEVVRRIGAQAIHSIDQQEDGGFVAELRVPL